MVPLCEGSKLTLEKPVLLGGLLVVCDLLLNVIISFGNSATVVGVLSEDGKPAGVIYFRKGGRLRKGEEVRQKVPVGVPAPANVNI